MSYEFKGKCYWVGPVEQVTDSFKKRLLIVVGGDNPQYPQHVQFEAKQDRVSLFDNIQAGQDLEVSFNIDGRLHTNQEGVTRCYTTLTAWKVNAVQQQAPAPQPTAPAPQPVAPTVPVQGPPAQGVPPQSNTDWMQQQHAQQQQNLQNNPPAIPGSIPPTSPV